MSAKNYNNWLSLDKVIAKEVVLYHGVYLCVCVCKQIIYRS